MAQVKIVSIPVLGARAINTYLLVGRRPVIVDAGTPGSGKKIRDAVAAHGVDPRDIALIVLTHGHIDHFGSAAELHRLTGAPIVGHAADLTPYRAGKVQEPYRPTGLLGRLLASRDAVHARTESIEPAIVVRGPLDLAEHGVDARIMPTPGHTAGSISVLTDHGDLVAGDLVASSFMGLVAGKPANPPFHDDPVGNLASLRAMLALHPTRLHVGHGGPLDPARVARWADREQRRLTRLAARGRLPRRLESRIEPPATPLPES
ncbi:MAG: MBL fold metallo-hydrolase [Actinobacteria bacterium]|nr:MBL fold metallo-hydrolase [Actinomycetota bacterium]MBI3687291.1 MBL fold metallo-hydrolase [Actinomycetota bacterium]